ncbi:hypothetical protein [Novosphingobium sp. ST904]|uniref:hypothetical protein n=1 Tax=Novosphingobium sp. ST904 TaxID=1684385 RepID=UPI0006CE173F|nr:hypothetical protein [Novosphingobium sp. ST904]KPH62341.1 hypothetical protein ADT71_15525 [Novosphingobium sp. ST904]TCM43309.1 hypothetical protein EDF59_101413 [Novosphingobium sp. ST904]
MTVVLLLVAAASGVISAPTEDQRLVLWQTLREGMSVEEAASALRAVDGIGGVTVKKTSKGSRLNIGYVGDGIEVDGLQYKASLVFSSSGLTTVHLQTDACLSRATQKYESLRELLIQKYGNAMAQREVTEDRQLVAIRNTFDTTPTRVLLRLEPGTVPQHTYGASGKLMLLAQNIANNEVDSQIVKCPNDRGQRATLEVSYLSNTAAQAASSAAAAEASAQGERDKSKL